MSETDMQAPPPNPKLDPETLVLRGIPRRVVRFRRQIIIGGGAVAAVLVGGIAWYSLRHVSPVGGAAQSDQAAPVAKATPEALAGAPRNYGDVPQLGPALPGDLGKPILDHQQSLGAGAVAGATDPAAQAALAEHQKNEAERRSARESGVMVQIAGGGRNETQPLTVAGSTNPQVKASEDDAAPGAKLALDPEHDPGSQQRKVDFLAAKDGTGDANPHELVKASSPYTLSAGTVLAASLITGLKSDLPGLVTAQVTENAYDSATGHYLLIPQGSRLIGSYDSVVAYGQNRALLVWQRIILPDGSSVRIDNVPASDLSGYAGLADKVDVHTWQLLKGVVLSTMLGVSAQLSFGSDESDLLRALRQSTQQSVSRAGDQVVSRALNVQPTITVRPGWPLRVVVHKDIVMPQPWGMGRRP
ncbi:TrbI/VirB10 family protein [Novosphingobium rosa]|uniref:TrbI/VirB10 family protein n=1 Tax=Novosphingobium rosa TaxID=76978 RepID=UPI0008349946|nr:TrbI/VirB10 family protein [Novosphingobium rosa]